MTRARRPVRLALVVGVVAVTVAGLGRMVLGDTGNPSALPAEKQALLRAEDQLRAGTSPRPKPRRPDRPSGPSVLRDSRWPTGIFDDGEFPSPDYRFVNRWTGRVHGRHVTVYAGSYARHPSRGLVLVMTASLDLQDVEAREYPSPPGVGPVRIVARDGTTITLRGDAGRAVTFDAWAHRFGSP